jgi:hypothetical protein
MPFSESECSNLDEAEKESGLSQRKILALIKEGKLTAFVQIQDVPPAEVP